MSGTQTIYEGINEEVLAFIPPSASRILDIGCGTGSLGGRLREIQERVVVGITYSQVEAGRASTHLSQVVCTDLNNYDFSPLGTFDCVVMSHILEHIYSPEDLLQRLKSVLNSESRIVVALPNVLFWRQRLEFLFGRWRYRDWGILDRTHFRFFDRPSSRRLLEDSGFEILRSKDDGPFFFVFMKTTPAPLKPLFGPIAKKLDRVLCKIAPGLFAFQFVYLARLRP